MGQGSQNRGGGGSRLRRSMAPKSRWLEGYNFEGVPGKIILEGMKKEGAGQQDEASLLGVGEGGAARWDSGMLLEGLMGIAGKIFAFPIFRMSILTNYILYINICNIINI